MTAVANPPSFSNLNRPGWINGGQSLGPVNADDARGINMFAPTRKTLQRSNSSSSVSSTSSTSSASSVTTVTSNASSQLSSVPTMPTTGDANQWNRKRPLKQGPWTNGKTDGAVDFPRATAGRVPQMPNGLTNGGAVMHNSQQSLVSTTNNSHIPPNGQAIQQGQTIVTRQPMLWLVSLNSSFERKTITVPFFPETLRIGRQTNAKTVPTPQNGYFDSKVLSRQHAEIWADANGKIWIRDIKSSNGTFVNGTRLAPENRESEPCELHVHDHLELGIDIVSEDQKTVVHHKVAARVEHAGFVTTTTNIADGGTYVDLETPNGTNSTGMMLPQPGPTPGRGRAGSQPGAAGTNRLQQGNNNGGAPVNALAQQRQYWLTPVTTDHIVKKLQAEMRNARLQNQDLARTSQFLKTLLSKDDIRNGNKPEVSEAPKHPLVNGNISLLSDGGKTRFSDPPAPPPSQPLPEKPDAVRSSSADGQPTRKGTNERSKQISTSSPGRQDNKNLERILQLTEELSKAKQELDSHSAKIHDLEEMLSKEREARLHAEDMVHKLEESRSAKLNGSTEAPLPDGHSELDSAFEPPIEQPASSEAESVPALAPAPVETPAPPQPDTKAEEVIAAFQARIDAMTAEMNSLREQLDAFRLRAERAEAERDADRKTLAELVLQIRQRDEEARRVAERRARSLERSRRRSPSPAAIDEEKAVNEISANGAAKAPNFGASLTDEKEVDSLESLNGSLAPSHGTTLKPSSSALKTDGTAAAAAAAVAEAVTEAQAALEATLSPAANAAQRQQDAQQAQQQQLQQKQKKDHGPLLQSLPYASMIGVVLFGMGIMAYLNGWQPSSARLDR